MSKRSLFKDSGGRLLGWTEEVREGIDVARSHAGELLGSHDSRSDVTRDAAGRLIGRGNFLPSLVVNRERRPK